MLQLWDSCNRHSHDRMLLFIYIWFVTNSTFDTIEHKFLKSGHSYSASDFITIEKRAKRCKLCNVDNVKRAIPSSRLDRPFKFIDMGKITYFDLYNTLNTQI